MIRRPVSGLHICLRCQIRLGRRFAPAIRHEIIRTKSTTSDGSLYNERSKNEKVFRSVEGSNGTELVEFKAARLHGYTGNLQEETSAALGVKALGKNAEVIILRDANLKRNKAKLRDIEEAEARERIDILAKIKDETGLVSDLEVQGNINNFRPKGDGNLEYWEDLNDLVQDLDESFTFSQLKRYMRTFEGRITSLPPLTPDIITDESPISRVSPWMPKISESGKAFSESLLRGYSLNSYTAKQSLSLQLIRECWQVKLVEVEEGIGEVEVQINPADLELLLRQGILASISQGYVFNESEKIEVIGNREVVRITSTREKCILIIREIADALKYIIRVQLPIKAIYPKGKQGGKSGWDKKHLTRKVLQRLGQLTDTEIEKTTVAAQPNLIVSNIDYNPATETSKRSDVARRLLLTSTPLSQSDVHRIECKLPTSIQPRSFIKYQGLRDLPWHQRLRDWSRWTTAMPQLQETDAPQEGAQPESSEAQEDTNVALPNIASESDVVVENSTDKIDMIFGGFTKISQLEDEIVDLSTGRNQAYWRQTAFVDTSAVVGTVLHNINSDRILDSKTLQATIKPDVLHTFSPHVPNLSRMFRSLPPLKDEPIERLQMRFKPNPWAKRANGEMIGAAALKAFPTIEMRFDIGLETRDVKIRSVEAIKSSEVSDLMLPDSAFDLRFRRRVVIYMAPWGVPNQANYFSPSIEAFLEKCKLDLNSNKPLETPPSLMIPLAEHICAPNAYSLVGSPKNGVMFDVEYLFTGLEYASTMFLEFEGWKLRYTSIEAGKAGGSRSELRLLPVRVDSQPVHEHDFMEAAYKLADTIDQHSTLVGRTNIRDRPRMIGASKLIYTNTPGTESRFKFFAARPSDFVQRNKR